MAKPCPHCRRTEAPNSIVRAGNAALDLAEALADLHKLIVQMHLAIKAREAEHAGPLNDEFAPQPHVVSKAPKKRTPKAKPPTITAEDREAAKRGLRKRGVRGV